MSLYTICPTQLITVVSGKTKHRGNVMMLRQILAFMTIGFATGSIVYIDGGALII
jgi:hypothetical protein